MEKPLRVLLVEDSADDAEIITRELRRGGYEPVYELVDSADAVKAAFDGRTWDLVLADYTMPGFSGLDALKELRRRGLDTPFIFISGSIGEDVAVAAMKAGAQDYLIKGNLKRLVPAIERELQEARVRKDIEEQLRRSQRMEALGQLTGGLAHDFNNLLTIVINNLDMLMSEFPLEALARSMAQGALEASLRGAGLIRQLLAFARRQPLETQVFNVNERVTGIMDLLRRTLGEQIKVEMKLADDLWPTLADPAQVESALVNLAINSRDAMPDGGRLAIETANKRLDDQYAADNADAAPGDYVMLAVSDSGKGMSKDILGRVSEPFFTTKGPGKGTGLGLSMVYGFAKQSGGHLKIYSEVGQGTTVRLYLPRAAVAGARGAQEPPAVPAMATRDATILVVEDNPGVRAVALKQLRSLGYRIIESEDAASALTILQTAEPVDLLFTDVVMPGNVTGVQLASEARKVRPGLKVLLTSGFSEVPMPDGGRPDATTRFLSKPYRKYELALAVRDLLHSGQVIQ